MLKRIGNIIACLLLAFYVQAQIAAPAQEQLQQIPRDYIDKVLSRMNGFDKKLEKKAEKQLEQFKKSEAKIARKMAKKDSLKAKELIADAEKRYKEFEERLSKGVPGQSYIPSLDTLSTSLRFLQEQPGLIGNIRDADKKLKDGLSKIKELEGRFQKAEEIKKFLKERKLVLKEQLSKLGLTKELKKLNKQVYYYSQQLNEYKEMLKDHNKLEKKTLELLSKTKIFRDFMKKNSGLASLLRVPAGDMNDPSAMSNLAGLQTRAQVGSLIQQQINAGGPNGPQQFRQNIQSAQDQLAQLRNRVSQSGNSDMEMPEGFKPNNQKTKSFLQRLEYGTDIQTQKATGFFPATSDIGLSLGYKLNDKSIIGIGASYKMGLGRGWNQIAISHQGIGLRSFIDWKLKGSFWISGGYEQNYKTAFQDIEQLRDRSAWQSSGLVGVSKVVSLKTKFFKKTRVRLLWDFLSYQQVPVTPAILLRIGYNF